MKRLLKHPINSIREPFGTAGLIVAMIALVAALGGTALAAAKLNSTQKKEVEKIAKKFAGKPGAAGANGTNGTPGAKGENGAPGAPGTSVTNAEVKPTEVAKCSGHGGAEFKVGSGSATFACNGQTGFTETLPPKKTETGTWGLSSVVPGELQAVIPLSFPIPLETALDETHVHVVPFLGEGEEGCEGGTSAEPIAEPGNLCIYISAGGDGLNFETIGNVLNPETNGAGAGKSGAVIHAVALSEEAFGWGDWAVTAPE